MLVLAPQLIPCPAAPLLARPLLSRLPRAPRVATRRRRAMAWACSATTHDALVTNLEREGLVTSPRAVAALRAVDRGHFLPADAPHDAVYADAPHPLPARATISAPHMHAMVLQLLADAVPAGALAVLDVGAGSGYLCAALAVLAGREGRVVGLEHAPELARLARDNLARWRGATDGAVLARAAPIEVREADGRLGDAQAGEDDRFNLIHVGAAAPELPRSLVDQLAAPGALVVPVGPAHGSQELVMVTRAPDGTLSQRVVCGVRYVPLCSLRDQVDDER